ncbi:MAG: helical backbone metal receptor [Myxococcota bacterium]
MRRLVDGRGVACEVATPPHRIVSLVPSTTETLHALGLQDRVVGATRFCIRPSPWARSLPRVGGTKDADPGRIRDLKPDLIVANCEENTREIFDVLDGLCPIWAAFPRDVDGAVRDLTCMGELLGAENAAADWVRDIQSARAEAAAAKRKNGSFSYAWLIWNDPLMTVSDDTFVGSMMAEVGGINVFADHTDRFPTTDAATLGAAAPDVVLLSSEPFPFKARHLVALSQATGLAPERFRFVDGQHGTWHGVRMAEGLRSLSAIGCL